MLERVIINPGYSWPFNVDFAIGNYLAIPAHKLFEDRNDYTNIDHSTHIV